MLIKKGKDFVYTNAHVKGQTDDIITVCTAYSVTITVCAIDVTFWQEGYVGDILVCSDLVYQQNRTTIVL